MNLIWSSSCATVSCPPISRIIFIYFHVAKTLLILWLDLQADSVRTMAYLCSWACELEDDTMLLMACWVVLASNSLSSTCNFKTAQILNDSRLRVQGLDGNHCKAHLEASEIISQVQFESTPLILAQQSRHRTLAKEIGESKTPCIVIYLGSFQNDLFARFALDFPAGKPQHCSFSLY